MKLRSSVLVLCAGMAVACGGQVLDAPSSAASCADDDAAMGRLLHAVRPPLRFRADDVFTVERRVGEDGTVLLPFLGRVPVAGQTPTDLELQIERLLAAAGIVREPQVTVHAVSQPWVIVTVSGDVAHPGTFPAFGNLTVIDYLSQAGGLNENPSPGPPANSPANAVVTLIRPSLPTPVSIDLGADARHSPLAKLPVFPGDEIRVAKLGVVYAVGAFRTEGAYPLKSATPTTMLQLVALAGGIGYQADKKDARILRSGRTGRQELNIDVGRILKGKAADVPLQADDIVFVPTNSMKAALKGGGSGVIVSLAAAYLYAHP